MVKFSMNSINSYLIWKFGDTIFNALSDTIAGVEIAGLLEITVGE